MDLSRDIGSSQDVGMLANGRSYLPTSLNTTGDHGDDKKASPDGNRHRKHSVGVYD